MGSNPGRSRRAGRFGNRQPTRMTEYQRNRQAEQPRGEVKVHAHLHGLTLNAAVELDEAGAFEGVPCADCGQAIEWSAELDQWQHHATKRVKCRRGTTSRTVRGRATPPDWYAGDPELDDAFAPDDVDDETDADEAAAQPEPTPVKPSRVDGNPYTTEWALGILAGLQDKPQYQKGTVHPDEVARRRMRNRDANRSRRANRRARVKRSRARHQAAS